MGLDRQPHNLERQTPAVVVVVVTTHSVLVQLAVRVW
jgi:hypothetical protein